MRPVFKKLLIGIGVVLFLLGAAAAVGYLWLTRPEVAWTDGSPDGRYRIVVWRVPMLVAMPGQGSDASGFIQLQDSDGRVLREKDVDMVSIVEQPEWSPGKVYIKLLVDWELPADK